MSTLETPQTCTPENAALVPQRSGKPTFGGNLIVTGFGFATSMGVAQLLNYSDSLLTLYTAMMAYVIPIGAIIYGYVVGIGYWAGARLFNHRPSRWLVFNIVLVSLTTFFAIHHIHYSNDKVSGKPVSSFLSYGDYLIARMENMTYIKSGDRSTNQGRQLGKFGWGVALLQVAGLSFGVVFVVGSLLNIPYCNRCAKYLSGKKTRVAKWKDAGVLNTACEEVGGLMQQGQLQAAIDKHTALGGRCRMSIKEILFSSPSDWMAAILSIELRKCPVCERRRLLLRAQMHNGKKWTTSATLAVDTEEPLRMA
jgi:hypothetical protein